MRKNVKKKYRNKVNKAEPKEYSQAAFIVIQVKTIGKNSIKMCRILWYRKTLSGSSGLTKGYACFVSTVTNLGINVAAKITTISSPVFPDDFIRPILINHCLYNQLEILTFAF